MPRQQLPNVPLSHIEEEINEDDFALTQLIITFWPLNKSGKRFGTQIDFFLEQMMSQMSLFTWNDRLNEYLHWIVFFSPKKMDYKNNCVYALI